MRQARRDTKAHGARLQGGEERVASQPNMAISCVKTRLA
jgi:hypothetical protein